MNIFRGKKTSDPSNLVMSVWNWNITPYSLHILKSNQKVSAQGSHNVEAT